MGMKDMSFVEEIIFQPINTTMQHISMVNICTNTGM
jgi:hypothetical protein